MAWYVLMMVKAQGKVACTESAIDLTLVSSNLAGVSMWEVKNHSPLGSDHYPLIVKVGIELQRNKELRIPRWKLEKANWQAFADKSEIKYEEIFRESIEDIDKINQKVSTAIIKAAQETIPKSTGKNRKKSVPWWDKNCEMAIKGKNRAFKQLKKQHNLETLVQYRKAQAIVRKTVKTAKRMFWWKYCSSIGRETALARVWGMIRKMNGNKSKYEIPVLYSNNSKAISNMEKAELFANTFLKVHASDNLSAEARQSRNDTLMQHPGVTKRQASTGRDLDLPFTVLELKRAIANARQTSPGKDDICYKMLANMKDNSLTAVLKLFNLIWEKGKIPSAWKQSVIVPILKPGKDQTRQVIDP